MDQWFFNEEFNAWIKEHCYGGKSRYDAERPRIPITAENVFKFGLIDLGVAVYFAAFHVNAEIPHYIRINRITQRSITGTPYVRYVLEHDHVRTLDHDNTLNAESNLYLLVNTAQEYVMFGIIKALEGKTEGITK